MSYKTAIQSSQYAFPYHYLVDIERKDFVRNLDWGLDYLTYMRKVRDLVVKYIRDGVLDIGCGDGFLLNHLARQTNALAGGRGVGLDVDGKAIRFAQAFGHDLDNVGFLEQDISTYNESSSLITCVETFEHIPDAEIRPFVGHVDRLLRPGGHLIISVPSIVRPVIEKHFRHYDLEMLESYFPEYRTVEVHYVSARRNVVYRAVSKLLANRYVNLNFGPFKKMLMAIHERYTCDVGRDRGAHIVAVFRKGPS